MSLKVQRPEATYELLAKIPTIAGGFLVKDRQDAACPPSVMLRRSQKDLANDEARSSLINFLPTASSGSYAAQPFPMELNAVSTMAPSPSGRLLAVVRSRDVKGKKEQSLEVWDGGSLVTTVSGNGELHGAVYAGDVFSSLEWSPDESSLVYVAERKPSESSSFWQAKPAASSDWEGLRWGGDDYVRKKGRGEEFDFVDDWGELCVGKSVSRLFVLHVESGAIKQVPPPEEGWAAGQGVWTPDGGGVVFTAFSHEPKRLGVRFYNTRKSRLCYAPAPSFLPAGEEPPGVQGSRASSTSRGPVGSAATVVLTSSEDWSARSPRFSPDGSRLAFVVSADSAAHFSCSKLCVASWPEGAAPKGVLPREVVVDIVHTPTGGKDSFPGLFLASEQLPRRVWLSDSRRMVLHSDWRSQRELVVVDTSAPGGRVERLDAGKEAGEGSWVLHDVCGDHVLASRSSPSQSPTAFVLRVSEGCRAEAVDLTGRLPKGKGAALLDDIEWSVTRVSPSDGGDGQAFDALLVQRKGGDAQGKVPLVVYPHGGPHSNQGVDMYAGPTLLALHGMAVLVVNYRGSTGYGQSLLESLLGKVGRQDVDDCVAATKAALAASPHLDGDAVVACGGSHGGFLSLHLVGQFGSLFKAAAVRNPVTNIASMFGTTDIPDWCFTEIGEAPSYAQPTPQQYVAALESSPMRYVSKVTAPVLLLVGGADRRVPPSQSKEYYHAMKEGGQDVEMRWYADHTHGLTETPRGEGDGLVHILKFFESALEKSKSK